MAETAAESAASPQPPAAPPAAPQPPPAAPLKPAPSQQRPHTTPHKCAPSPPRPPATPQRVAASPQRPPATPQKPAPSPQRPRTDEFEPHSLGDAPSGQLLLNWKTAQTPLPRGKTIEGVDWLTDFYRFLATGVQSGDSYGVPPIRVPLTLVLHFARTHCWYASIRDQGVHECKTMCSHEQIVEQFKVKYPSHALSHKLCYHRPLSCPRPSCCSSVASEGNCGELWEPNVQHGHPCDVREQHARGTRVHIKGHHKSRVL